MLLIWKTQETFIENGALIPTVQLEATPVPWVFQEGIILPIVYNRMVREEPPQIINLLGLEIKEVREIRILMAKRGPLISSLATLRLCLATILQTVRYCKC